MSLTWLAMQPFGVELLSVDLSGPLTAEESAQLRDLFNAHGLILARGQALSMERQQELCALLGPILLREGENGYLSNEARGPSASELNWHSDAAYTPHPFDAIALHAVDVVDGASSTRFADAQIILPDRLQSALEGREQEMIAPHYTMLAEVTCDRRDPEAQKRGTMPTFHVNPHNGRRCVWVNAMQTARLLDMEWETSRDLLHEVYDRLYQPANTFEHHWHNGDFIVWDNIALQHMRGNTENAGKRVLQRVIVGVEGVAPHIGN